jgi:hypothetical protein
VTQLSRVYLRDSGDGGGRAWATVSREPVRQRRRWRWVTWPFPVYLRDGGGGDGMVTWWRWWGKQRVRLKFPCETEVIKAAVTRPSRVHDGGDKGGGGARSRPARRR